MGTGTDEGWQRVHAAVMARYSDMGVTLTRLYQLTRLSEGTYRKMREGIPLKRQDKRRNLTDGLGWTSDSIDRILAGGEPQLSEVPSELTRLERVERELREVREIVMRLSRLFPPEE